MQFCYVLSGAEGRVLRPAPRWAKLNRNTSKKVMMSHIEAFNRTFKSKVRAIEDENLPRLLREMRAYNDYYSAADSIGFKYGLEFRALMVEDAKGRTKYIPTFKKMKITGSDVEVEQQVLSSTPMDHADCYSLLAKEWLYGILINEAFLLGQSIHR